MPWLGGNFVTRQIGSAHESDEPFDESTTPAEVFAGNASCVLSPDGPEGPYCE